ncbi:uncharacterized protein C8Q71DRAFT_90875 [Rhodofomes roseus]|uniref:Uncharacterized protein n=1 Tax=Rhodofomes roseus TaxID=34475 RepID=A0ABQ8KDR3_9APHY|nr:uncharacterized protein C8Q71DRAFT_90875 [Rhodofomes roseus]KAH9835681.1 hypothetical protein C8Q71DRAFT_90875 [Rhodofomes roseus]
MVDSRSLRANPRPSSKGATLDSNLRLRGLIITVRRRASSVPVELARDSERLRVTAGSLKRKRTSARESMQDEGIFLPYTSTQPIAGPSRRLTLNMPAIDEQRSAGEYAPADGGVQEIGLLTPAPSQSKFTSKPQSTRRRTSTATSKKDKGKQKATPDDAPSEDDTESVRSAPETSRPAKRRRTSRSGGLDGQLPNDPLSDRTPHPQSSDDMEEDTYSEAELEASFQLLDISDVAALSTIPIDPTISLPISEKEGSLYVPPAVARIIDTLKHALVLERTARQRAEERYGDELRRRVHAELVTDMLTQKNAVLEVETRVWANAAADTFAEQFATLQGSPSGASVEAGAAPSTSTQLMSMPQPSVVSTNTLGLSVPQGDGRTQDVLQRAAGQCACWSAFVHVPKSFAFSLAVQQFFEQLIPMPVPNQQRMS